MARNQRGKTMKSKAETTLRELWTAEFRAILAYSYRTVQRILAGGPNPVFPPFSTLEELSADGVAEAFSTSLRNAERIMKWEDPQIRRKVLLAFVRNGCRHAIAAYRKRRCYRLDSDIPQPEENLTEGFEELILSLPPVLRATAELLAQGKTYTETAELLGVDRTTVFRHRKRIGQLIGAELFYRWLVSNFGQV